MADYKTCEKHDMDLCPIARRFANNPKVRFDCSKCKDYRSSEKQCGDCKHYDARDAYCGIKQKFIFFREKSAACYYYEERQKEMSVIKSCKTCKYMNHGTCYLKEWICNESNGWIAWELSDDAKADLLHDAEKVPIVKENTEPGHDSVNHPNHYTQGEIECIDALKAATVGLSGIEAVCTANAIKYLWRWKHKNGVQDIDKAIWYLNRLKKELEV